MFRLFFRIQLKSTTGCNLNTNRIIKIRHNSTNSQSSTGDKLTHDWIKIVASIIILVFVRYCYLLPRRNTYLVVFLYFVTVYRLLGSLHKVRVIHDIFVVNLSKLLN